MRPIRFLSVLALPALLAAAPRPAPVLIELFSSQGCSSCPPAEALMERWLTDPPAGFEVIPLVFHVDYWDRLGWADPFSRPAWTRRQYAYARAWNSERVYTPQAVINGALEGVGSDPAFLRKHLAPLRRLDLRRTKTGLRIGGLAAGQGAWLAVCVDAGEIRVLRGENQGRRLPVPAAVVSLEPLTVEDGSAAHGLPSAERPGRWRVVAFQREGAWGPVTAAGSLILPEP